MARTGERRYRCHPRESRDEARKHAGKDVGGGSRILSALDQTDGLKTERGEGGEATAKTDDEKGTQLGGCLQVEQIPDKDADEEAAGDVYEHGADREPACARALDGPPCKVTENRADGAAERN